MGTHEATFRKPPFIFPYRAASYLDTHYGATSTAVITQNDARTYPWIVTQPVILTRLGVDITSAGETGAVTRIALYYDDGSGRASTLLLDAGTVAADAIATPEITISQLVQPGVLWLTAVNQLCATTPPTLRTLSNAPIPGMPNSTFAANQVIQGYSGSPVAGAFPATFPFVGAGAAIRVSVKTA
jgi:hypothetical protein